MACFSAKKSFTFEAGVWKTFQTHTLHLTPAVCGSFVMLRYTKPPQPSVISAFPLATIR